MALYDVERDAAELDPEQRRAIREERGRPIAQALHLWMLAQRKLVSEGSAIAKALDYNLKRWQALTRYLDDPHVPIDNNQIENLIRPWAIGRAYRHLVVMESSIRMAGADTCETMPRPRIIEVVASRQALIGFRHRLSSLHNYRPCRNRSRSSFGL